MIAARLSASAQRDPSERILPADSHRSDYIVYEVKGFGKGRNSDAAIVVASWFTGEARIALRDPNTGAETIAAYRTDLNLNGVTLSNPDGGAERYDPGDSVSGGNYRLFCLTSPVSFSCGNLVPAMFERRRIQDAGHLLRCQHFPAGRRINASHGP